MPKTWIFLVTLSVLVLPRTSVLAQEESESLTRLSWLSGCWRKVDSSRVYEEQWMKPSGRTMIGMNRTVSSGVTVAWEFLRIFENEKGISLTVLPSGQIETTFQATGISNREVSFLNSDHDFPQIIRYKLLDDDSLLGQIEGVMSGVKRIVDFPMDRAPCP